MRTKADFRAGRKALRSAGSRATLLGVLGAVYLTLGGCEPLQYGPDTPVPGDTAIGSATVLLMNQRETDEGDLVFMLFPTATQDINDANPSKEFEPVGFQKSLSVQVPAGRWKVGYQMENGDHWSMPTDINESENADWPVAVFAKGKSYQILIETDVGGNTVWRHNVPKEATAQ